MVTLKVLLLKVGTGTTLSVKVLSHVSAAGTVTNVNYQNGGVYNFTTGNIGLATVAAGTNVGGTPQSLYCSS